MKKTLIITLVEEPQGFMALLLNKHFARKFVIDVHDLVPDLPIGTAANDLRLLKLTSELAKEGFCPDTKSNRPIWIAPSQIKTIEIVFENNLSIEK